LYINIRCFISDLRFLVNFIYVTSLKYVLSPGFRDWRIVNLGIPAGSGNLAIY